MDLDVSRKSLVEFCYVQMEWYWLYFYTAGSMDCCTSNFLLYCIINCKRDKEKALPEVVFFSINNLHLKREIINQISMIFNKLGSDGGLFIVIGKKNIKSGLNKN